MPWDPLHAPWERIEVPRDLVGGRGGVYLFRDTTTGKLVTNGDAPPRWVTPMKNRAGNYPAGFLEEPYVQVNDTSGWARQVDWKAIGLVASVFGGSVVGPLIAGISTQLPTAPNPTEGLRDALARPSSPAPGSTDAIALGAQAPADEAPTSPAVIVAPRVSEVAALLVLALAWFTLR